jgi:hypothetical protein
MRHAYKQVLLAAAAAVLAYGQVPVTVKISNEVVPAGGMAQVKVLLTSPQPITGGGVKFDGALSLADGISLSSTTGDVFGAALQNGSQIDVRFTSPKGTFGTEADYPLMTFTFGVDPAATPGQTTPADVGSSSLWQTLIGSQAPVEIKPGSVTVGGSISVTDVIPGGGTLPAGATFSILGTGFTPRTKVHINPLVMSSATYVSPTEIQVTLLDGGTLDGTEIRLKNPDGSLVYYYSYLRGVKAGVSTHPLIARAVPIFSTKTSVSAVLPPMILPQFNSPYAVGVALQNPGPDAADVTLELVSAPGPPVSTATITLAPRARISRELSEWFTGAIPAGASVRVRSTNPIQVLGLLANTDDGTVLPMAFVLN